MWWFVGVILAPVSGFSYFCKNNDRFSRLLLGSIYVMLVQIWLTYKGISCLSHVGTSVVSTLSIPFQEMGRLRGMLSTPRCFLCNSGCLCV